MKTPVHPCPREKEREREREKGQRRTERERGRGEAEREGEKERETESEREREREREKTQPFCIHNCDSVPVPSVEPNSSPAGVIPSVAHHIQCGTPCDARVHA